MKRFQYVWFKNKLGFKLEANLALPKTKPPYPIIVVAPGFSSSKDSSSYTVLERKLLPRGVAVFRFNYRGHGNSEGDWKSLTISGVIEDIKVAIDYVFDNFSEIFDKNKVILYGGSFSGYPVVHVASKDKRVKFLICRCGVINVTERLERLYDIEKWKKEGKIKTPTDQPKLAWFSYDLYKDSLKYNGAKVGKKVKVPTFLLHGTGDVTVKHQHSKELFKYLSVKDKTLKSVEGVDHWFRGKRREMQQIIVDWIEKKIK